MKKNLDKVLGKNPYIKRSWKRPKRVLEIPRKDKSWKRLVYRHYTFALCEKNAVQPGAAVVVCTCDSATLGVRGNFHACLQLFLFSLSRLQQHTATCRYKQHTHIYIYIHIHTHTDTHTHTLLHTLPHTLPHTGTTQPSATSFVAELLVGLEKLSCPGKGLLSWKRKPAFLEKEANWVAKAWKSYAGA